MFEKRKRETRPQLIDRLPPHSIEAEQGILGCILLSPNECLSECISKIGVNGECFYDLRHAAIYETMAAMFDARESVDVITLQLRLKDKHQLESVGGIAYLSSLPDAVPSAANLAHYLEIVEVKAMLRKTIHVCTEIVGRIYEYEGDADSLLDEVERDILKIRRVRKKEVVPIKQLTHQAMAGFEQYHERHGALLGLATGFADLDKMTGGLQGGDFDVVAGYPGSGKTSIAMNIAEHVVLESKVPVAVFSLEMTAIQLVMRFLCSRARINIRNVREGFLAERDFPKLVIAAGQLASSTLYIDDTNDLSIFQLRARARRMSQQYGIKLVIVDYLQLLSAAGAGKTVSNRTEEIGAVSGGLKNLAKELNVPVIALSQLTSLDGGKSRLRGAAEIGQDADMVCKLRRIEQDEPEDSEACPMALDIEKQRNGPTGTVNVTFFKQFTRFESAARISDTDEPRNAYAD